MDTIASAGKLLHERLNQMKQVTGYPVIDEILESMRPQAVSARSAEARPDEQLFDYCYAAIRRSGLYTQLECGEWDALAERLKTQVRGFVEELIDNELTRIQTEKDNNQ